MQRLSTALIFCLVIGGCNGLFAYRIHYEATREYQFPPRELVPRAYYLAGKYTTGKCYRCHCGIE